MTDLNPVEKAEQAVRAAETDTVAVQLALAAVELAKAAAQQQTSRQEVCQHQHKPGRSAGEWLAIGCAACVGGVGLAFVSLALAILGGVAAILVLVLRDMWRDSQKGRR